MYKYFTYIPITWVLLHHKLKFYSDSAMLFLKEFSSGKQMHHAVFHYYAEGFMRAEPDFELNSFSTIVRA